VYRADSLATLMYRLSRNSGSLNLLRACPDPNVKHPLFLPDFNKPSILLADFRNKNFLISIFMKILPFGVELLHAEREGRTDGQAEITQLIFAFRNYMG
jgi:hypothetical protein